MRQVATALALSLGIVLALGCAAGGDLTRRENILRQRQYQLSKREAHLRAAKIKAPSWYTRTYEFYPAY